MTCATNMLYSLATRRLALRQAEAGAFGGFRADASNQQLLVEEPMAEAAGEGA